MPAVIEFTSFQDTIMFQKRGRFGLEKVQNSEINVKVVLDIPYYMVVCWWTYKFIKQNLKVKENHE